MPTSAGDTAEEAEVFAAIQAEQSARVAALQQHIARQHQCRGWMLALRLVLFVLAPTALTGGVSAALRSTPM
jgi:hypothetical protein